jgi:hypothetical protein
VHDYVKPLNGRGWLPKETKHPPHAFKNRSSTADNIFFDQTMPSINLNPLWIALAVLLFSTGCHAFGAGNIPTIAFLEGKAFRHGDIEDILADLLIRAASSSSTKSATGFAAKAVGKKFSGLNVKRTYFGNWLYIPNSFV